MQNTHLSKAYYGGYAAGLQRKGKDGNPYPLPNPQEGVSSALEERLWWKVGYEHGEPQRN